MTHRTSLAPLAATLLAMPVTPGAAENFKAITTRIRIEDCRAAVAAAHPGPVIKIEYKWRERRLIYEFEVAGEDGTRWEIECDGYSGKIVGTEREVASPDDPLFAANRRIGLEEARRVALERYPGEVVEAEYEIKNSGAASYEFDIRGSDGREWKLEVDAASGRIVDDAHEEFHQTGRD
ncbi:PepSY domain-containing protein [Methylotetracoccus oryzae]|uniref:PepSY domain-containing protein n=1 Tax=Methylotetracoccus oryzae TaxID=1919059 RepID=UPI00111A2552|nr:PepSY domain-containing protein [Methylotetracoccus oryzae]